VKIEHEIALRQQHTLNVVGDLRGRAAIGVARKAAIEIAFVEWRGAHSGHRRREVRRRQDDDAAAHLLRFEAADQFAERDLALVFVAVVAGHQQDSRAVAVLDAGNRDRDPAIGRAVHRIGQPDKAVLFAIAVKIDFGGETAPRAGHQWLLYARRSSPFDSMKVLCLNCTQFRLDTGNSWRALAQT